MDPSALQTSNWKQQLQYIEYVEEYLDNKNELDEDFIIQLFGVLSKYLESDNKNVLQRALKVLEEVGNKSFALNSDVDSICNVVSRCLVDKRSNIRQQSIRTIKALSSKIPIFNFLKFVDGLLPEFTSECKTELIQLIQSQEEKLGSEDWNCLLMFIIHILEDKSSNKTFIQELIKNELLLTTIEKNQARLNQAQKKLVQPYIDRKVGFEKSLDDRLEDGSRSSEPVFLNSSAFSRKKRNQKMKEDDGIKLLTDGTAFAAFFEIFSQDVRDVFEDELVKIILSKSISDRLHTLESFKEIFKTSSPSVFQNSIDIIIRWCGMQFLMRQVSTAQGSLQLLIENCVDKIRFTEKELYFIIPIVLWSIATKSDAYSDLLSRIHHCSDEGTYSKVLLYSIQLGHTAVVTTVFEALEEVKNLSSIEEELRKLTTHRNANISYPAKNLLFHLSPSSDNFEDEDPITVLHMEIQRIKTVPELISEPQKLFIYIYEQFYAMPSDERLIRYLLYCTHAFFSEPILASTIDPKDLVEFFRLLLAFSSGIPDHFSDYFNSISLIFVIIIQTLPFYETLIEYFDKNPDNITRQSFAYQAFSIANSLFCLDKVGSDLQAVRSLAKSAIQGCSDGHKNDCRTYLYKNLLSECVALEQTRCITAEYFRIAGKKDQPSISELTLIKDDMSNIEKFRFVKIVDKIATPASKLEGIHDLVLFDEENKMNGSAILAVCKLAPMLRYEIERYTEKK